MKKVMAQHKNKLITPKNVIKIFTVNSFVISKFKKYSLKTKYTIKKILKKSKKINILINNFVPYRYIAVKAKSNCL